MDLLKNIQKGVKNNKNVRKIRTTLKQKKPSTTSNKELNNIIDYNLRTKNCTKAH